MGVDMNKRGSWLNMGQGYRFLRPLQGWGIESQSPCLLASFLPSSGKSSMIFLWEITASSLSANYVLVLDSSLSPHPSSRKRPKSGQLKSILGFLLEPSGRKSSLLGAVVGRIACASLTYGHEATSQTLPQLRGTRQ